MAPSFLLTLREGLEAALIIGIVLGTLKRIRREDLKATVWAGTISAMAISLIVALLLQAIGTSLEGQAEEVFEGITMLLAAGVLTWMIFWMNRYARTLKARLETDVRRAVLEASKRPLFLVAFLAVIREGIELALFLSAASFTSNPMQTLQGALLGFAAVIVIAWALFSSLIRLNLRYFFLVTSVLLILFAAGLVAHGIHELNEARWVPAIVEHVWDINHLLDENSTVGVLLKTLVGYNGNPSLTEVLGYAAYFIAILLGLRWQNARYPVLQQGESGP